MSNRHPTEILIRRAYADDALALVRLAALDSADAAPQAPLVVAELDGELAVALSLADGSVIADPFRPTAAIVQLLVDWADANAERPTRLWHRRLRPASPLRLSRA